MAGVCVVFAVMSVVNNNLLRGAFLTNFVGKAACIKQPLPRNFLK